MRPAMSILGLLFALTMGWIPTHELYAMTPPTLTGTAISPQQVTLSWTDSTADVATYSIQRRVGSTGAFTQIATVPATTRSYQDSTVVVGTTYSYLVVPVLQTPLTSNPVVTATPSPPATPTIGTVLNMSAAMLDNGSAYLIAKDFGVPADTTATPTRSTLRLFENGVELGPAHSRHADIRNKGQGRFSHWQAGDGIWLYFSAKDNTNPKTNGRTYTFMVDGGSTPPPAVQSSAPPPQPVSAPSPPPAVAPPPTTGSCPSDSFYVSVNGNDGNSGTQSSPWRTIGKAANTLQPGQTACVMDGTYEEAEVQFNRSGSAGAPITVMAQNKWLAILSSVSGCNPNISLYGGYIVIDGLRSKISSNDVLCPRHPNSADGAAVRLWPDRGGHDSVIRNMFVDDSSHRSVGIKSNQDNALIENNIVYNSLEVMTGVNNIVRGNVTYGGDAWGSVFTSKGGTRNVQVYNNVFHMTNKSTEGGLILGGSSSCCMPLSDNYECYNCVAYNNVVINVSSNASLGLYGFRACKDCLFLNNVGIGGQWFTYQGGPASNNLTTNSGFKNNILVCGNGTATGGSLGWDHFTGMTVDYNNFYRCSTGVPVQTHAIAGDPKFVDPNSDWHVQSDSPAMGAGTAVPSQPAYGSGILDMSKNRDGVTRTAPWALGIY